MFEVHVYCEGFIRRYIVHLLVHLLVIWHTRWSQQQKMWFFFLLKWRDKQKDNNNIEQKVILKRRDEQNNNISYNQFSYIWSGALHGETSLMLDGRESELSVLKLSACEGQQSLLCWLRGLGGGVCSMLFSRKHGWEEGEWSSKESSSMLITLPREYNQLQRETVRDQSTSASTLQLPISSHYTDIIIFAIINP